MADHPVVWINQAQASIYCQWTIGRLPSEAEWERAARGSTPLNQRRFPWGNDAPEACVGVNLGACPNGTAAVASFEQDRTDTGVSDMIGNVHEMADGWYDPLYYRRAPENNPRGADRPNDMSLIPVRGGSYSERASFATMTYRGFRLLLNHRSGRPDVGFRCAHE
jgi:formylglycine-generating enzyme required for sulfatase activity